MSLRRQLGVSFAVQGAGAAAVLLATLWLGARLGPDVQGGFSRSKSEIEFVAAFAMFGLPQALFYHLKSGAMDMPGALRWALASAVVAAAIGSAYGRWSHPDAGAGAAAWLALAIAAAVGHGQLRSLLLVRERTVWFNAMTAAPQVGVLVGVGVVIAGAVGAGPGAWFAVFALAAAWPAALAWQRLRSHPAAAVRLPGALPMGRALLGYGLAAWLTAALATAAILAMQRWVEHAEGGAALGRFTLAMTLVQVPLTPVNYAAPLLFRRWMEQPGERASRRWAGRLFGLLAGVAALVALAAWRWPDLGLGPAYTGAAAALAVLLLGGAADAASRLLTVQKSATGLPWIAVGAEAARWGVLAAGWLALGRGATAPGLLALCALWSAGAMAAALVFVTRRSVR